MELEPTSKPRLPAEQGEKSELKVFQDTIAELRRKETAGETKTAHFTSSGFEVAPEELTDPDRLMWQKITNYPNAGPLSQKENLSYREAVSNSGVASRSNFAAYLNNRIVPIWHKLDSGEEHK